MTSDDELLDACRDAQACAVFFEVARQLGADQALLDELAGEVVIRAASLPARTTAGLRAKAEIAERWTRRPDVAAPLLASIAKDALALLEATLRLAERLLSVAQT